MKKILFFALFLCSLSASRAQVTIESGTLFYIQQKATIYLQGDLSSKSNINGAGLLELSGKETHINMNGYQIDNLSIHTGGLAELEGDMIIKSYIILGTGSLRCNSKDLVLGEEAAIININNNYFETNGSGSIRKRLSSDLNAYIIPLGNKQDFTPIKLNVSGKYHHAFIELSAKSKESYNKPIQARDFLKYHWIVKQQGITGNVSVTGHYNNSTDIEGNKAQLQPYYWDGFAWKPHSITGKPGNTVTANISSAQGELYAMGNISGSNPLGLKLLNNPAKGFTVLEISIAENKHFHLVVRDATGKQIVQRDINAGKGISRHVIHLQGIANGSYFLDVNSNNVRQTFKVIKVD